MAVGTRNQTKNTQGALDCPMSRRIDHQGSSASDQPPPQPGGWVLSREAVREVDRLATARFGMPSIVLMENAAIGLCTRAVAMLRDLGTARAVILAGPGNNGGDGFALARHLHIKGYDPDVLLTTDPARYAGDAATNLAISRSMGIPMHRLDVSEGAEVLEHAAQSPVLLVDALLGTGIRNAARGVIGDVILQVNRLRAPTVGVLAVDVPSGLDCNTGEPASNLAGDSGPTIEADATVTFVALKRGFLQLGAQRWTGEVFVAGIGVPRELVEALGEFVSDTRPGAATKPMSQHNAPDDPPARHGQPDEPPVVQPDHRGE